MSANDGGLKRSTSRTKKQFSNSINGPRRWEAAGRGTISRAILLMIGQAAINAAAYNAIALASTIPRLVRSNRMYIGRYRVSHNKLGFPIELHQVRETRGVTNVP
jgi:hypothetical protein